MLKSLKIEYKYKQIKKKFSDKDCLLIFTNDHNDKIVFMLTNLPLKHCFTQIELLRSSVRIIN